LNIGASEVRRFEQAGKAPVRGFLHVPAKPSGDGLVLSHGAGSDCSAPLLVVLAAAFSDVGLHVLRCDLPFRQLHPHGPPPRGSAEQDRAGLLRAVEAMRQQLHGRIYLGGHSYGGRQSSILAASHPGLVEGLLLLAYPLHPPKRPEQLRTDHFPSLRTPALFVHGTRDGFGSVEEMTEARKLIPAVTELLPVTGSGHDLLTNRNRETLVPMVVNGFQHLMRNITPAAS
jgi:uncharacterized protein